MRGPLALAALCLPTAAFAACPAGEAPIFSCRTDTAKEANVCQGQGTITYRYGVPEKTPTVVIPTKNTGVVWQHGESPRAGILDIFYFKDGATRYSIMHTANSADPANADAHITVRRPGIGDAFIECSLQMTLTTSNLKIPPREITDDPPLP